VGRLQIFVCKSLEFQIWLQNLFWQKNWGFFSLFLQNLFLAENSRFGFLAKLGLQASAWPHLFFVCLFVCFEPVFFVCVCFEFLVFIADLLLLFEVVVSQRRIVLFLNLVWELGRGGGELLGSLEMPQQKKKKAWMEMRRMFEEEREFGEKMRN
jgi:hypothetical protein